MQIESHTHDQLIDTHLRLCYLVGAFKTIGLITSAKDEYGNDVLDELQQVSFALAMSLGDVTAKLEDITDRMEPATNHLKEVAQ